MRSIIASLVVITALSTTVRAQEDEGEAKPAAKPGAAGTAAKKPREPDFTPVTLTNAETFVYRADAKPDPMRIHIFKPKGWKKGDKRPAMMFFFGGGWTSGNPTRSATYGKWAAQLGMVGVVPDYRTKGRAGTSPLESVADGRLALHWLEEHAEELGVDTKKIVVGGSSAGGHVALWTAIEHTPPGSATNEAPKVKPCALILISAVSDTAPPIGYTPKRFGDKAEALSPILQLDAKMPPVIAFHGDADTTVTNLQTMNLRDKLIATSNVCEFVPVPGGIHGFQTDKPEWKDKSRDLIKEFLTKQGILPVAGK